MLKTTQKRNPEYLLQGEKSSEDVVCSFVIFMIAKGSMITNEKYNHGSINSETQTQVY